MNSTRGEGVPTKALLDRRRRARAGLGVFALLLPHVVLGAYLWVVPDHMHFTTTQVVTLLHVALALLSLPVGSIWVVVHARSAPRIRAPGLQRARIALSVSAGLAVVSGVVALRYSEGMPATWVHGALGMLVALPLGAHLWAERKKRAAAAAFALLPLALGGAAIVRLGVPSDTAAPAVPEFAYETRELALYDRAQWCGSCHSAIFDEWKRSTHARTFELPELRKELRRHDPLLGVDLDDFGALAAGRAPASLSNAEAWRSRVTESCTHCHAPISFYGDDDTHVLDSPSGQSQDAVSCAFCHTLRANRVSHVEVPEHFDPHDVDPAEAVGGVTLAVSAPQTVRRYFWQASDQPLLRRIGDALIRWRPEMHRRDYHSPILDTSEVCRACHGMPPKDDRIPHRTYDDWASSSYASGPAPTQCQDCHMASRVTGEPRREPAALVPWGPERPQRRSHMFLGGNVNAHRQLQDDEMAALQHQFGTDRVVVTVEDVRLSEGFVAARLRLRARTIGHRFPALEAGVRKAWLSVTVTDAGGRVVGSSGKGDAALRLEREIDTETMTIVRDTTLGPDEERTVDVRVPLKSGSAPRSLEVAAHHSLDPAPIAVVTHALAVP